MFKFVYRIFLTSLLFFALATHARAQQEEVDTVVTIAPIDSVEKTLDSITEQITDTTYPAGEYEDEDGETLYFLGKEDSLSLYDSSVLQWRKVPDTTIKAFQKDPEFGYANKDRSEKKKAQKEPEQDNNSGFLEFLAEILGNAAVRQAIFIFILLLFAAAVIWFLVRNEMNLFGRSRRKIKVDQPAEGEPENIFTADLQAVIQNAESKGDYRLAVRLSYLLLLRKFSEEGWIKYKDDTTNMEYMMQLYNQPFYKEFFTVTRNYEYVWYGEMPVNKMLYDRVQQDFAILYTKAALSN